MDKRFRHHWVLWQDRTRNGKAPADFLAECSDETLVELLSYGDQGTAVERNVIATELTNRISRLHRAVATHSERVNGFLDDNERSRENAEADARTASDHARTASDNAEDAAGEMAKAAEADRGIREETDSLRNATDKTSRYERKHDGGW